MLNQEPIDKMATKLHKLSFLTQSLFFPPGTSRVKRRGSSFFPGITTLCTPVKAMAQLYWSWCLYKNFTCSEIDTGPLYRVEPYTHRASRESSPSPVYLLCCYHHTHGCALTLKKASKGDQNWKWSCGSSGSPLHTLLSHLYILLSTWKDLPLIEANKQIIKSKSYRKQAHIFKHKDD